MTIRDRARELLIRTPHLSEKERRFWLDRVESLGEKEMDELVNILGEENEKFFAYFDSDDCRGVEMAISRSELEIVLGEEKEEREAEENLADELVSDLSSISNF